MKTSKLIFNILLLILVLEKVAIRESSQARVHWRENDTHSEGPFIYRLYILIELGSPNSIRIYQVRVRVEAIKG